MGRAENQDTLDFEKKLQQMGFEDDEAADSRRKLLEEQAEARAQEEFAR